MTDLTDSYCERCGARYVFSPPAPKTMSLKGARVLAKGLKNFVMTDGQSMADSLSLARHEDGHEDSTRITEAFHKTFNFCMNCRQYACEKCWNVRAGACLSCAPEDGTEPVAREDHLLVRTPVARWDMDWSLFPGGPETEPVNKPAPLPFNAPIQFSDSVPAQTAEAVAPDAWPTADHLPAPDPGGIDLHAESAAHRASGRPVDPMAASLWPMADELAPEMTLTREELVLVESGLSHGEMQEDDAEAAEIAAAEAAVEPAVESAAEPEAGAAVELAPEPAVEPAPELAPVMGAAPEPAAEPAPELAPVMGAAVELAAEPAVEPAPELAPESAAAPAAEPEFAPAPEPAPQVYADTSVVPVWPVAPQFPTPPVEPATPPTPAPITWASASQIPASGSPWPRPTAWSERPVETQDWRPDGPAPSELPEPLPAASAAAPEMAPTVPDARSAAAMRLSGVPLDPGDSAQVLPAAPEAALDALPAAPTSEPTPVPADSSPWLSALDHQHKNPPPPVQPQLFNMPAPNPSQPQASGPDATGRRTPAAPWQPLGSSWPAAQDPRTPWPGPQMSADLPAVAAQQDNASTVTAMWAQSSQEVLSHGTVRVCHRCALPVSTHARFCRRCGTPQT